MEKIPQKTSVIALVHFLRGGVFVPIIASLVIGGPILFYIAMSNNGKLDETIGTIVSIPIMILGAFLGGIYSAKHIGKKYIITDPTGVVRQSAIIMVVVSLLLGANEFLSNPIWKLIQTVGMTVAFYAASNKYVRNSDEMNDNQNI